MGNKTIYDDVVVGSGISGLTAALILAQHGHKVLVLEKSNIPGGSLQRFRRNGITFDTGLHFTTGLEEGGLLRDGLRLLGIEDCVKPLFFNSDCATRMVFEEDGCKMDMPMGVENHVRKLSDLFPGSKIGIEQFFARARQVCETTGTMNFRTGLTAERRMLDEDYVTLQQVLDEVTDNRRLQTILGCYSACYGTRPKDVSFAAHARMTYGLCESIGRIEDGGDCLISAFLHEFERFGVEIRCNAALKAAEEVENRCAKRFLLENGEEIQAKRCLLSVHPHEILKIMPQDKISNAFRARAAAFESSCGFFTVYGVMDGAHGADSDAPLELMCPADDLNAMFDRDDAGDAALVLMRHHEKGHFTLNAYEVSQQRYVREWMESKRGKRPADYLEAKESRTNRIAERIVRNNPSYRDFFRVLGSATMLTYRDYLNSPDGSAYGIQQKMGQFNLFGRLPVRNMYAIGQSAGLPGVLGSMISSFMICRTIVGNDEFDRYLKEHLK